MVEKVPYNELALRVLGVFMAATSWSFVIFPDKQVCWKGGNRAPLSHRSKILFAVTATSWCLAAFRFYPLFFAALFAVCVSVGFVQSSRDRIAFDAARGVGPHQPRRITLAQCWPALCVLDGVILILMVYVFFRDLYHPPQTDEQHIVHVMGIGYLVASAAGAVYLYIKRPKKGTPTQN